MKFQLEAGVIFGDDVFAAYGLDHEAIRHLRRFLVTWCDDLSMRLAEAAQLALGR